MLSALQNVSTKGYVGHLRIQYTYIIKLLFLFCVWIYMARSCAGIGMIFQSSIRISMTKGSHNNYGSDQFQFISRSSFVCRHFVFILYRHFHSWSGAQRRGIAMPCFTHTGVTVMADTYECNQGLV